MRESGGGINRTSEPGGFLRRWGTVPLAVYAFGIFLPAVVVFPRDELMTVLGVPVYSLVFWTGPFASAAAVFWTRWSVGWRAIWVLLAPVLAATVLGLVVLNVL